MKTVCNVTNKSSGRVVYTIQEPNMNVRRVFYPGETHKNIKVEELEKLVQQPGGKVLLYNYLMVNDEEIIRHLINGDVAPEYWLTEAKIPSWINTCSIDEFKDALDFAPEGTKDLIKKYAVSVPLNDYSKRQAMLEQLGFDVSKALEASKEDGDSEEAKAETKKVVTRRSNTTSIKKPTE